MTFTSIWTSNNANETDTYCRIGSTIFLIFRLKFISKKVDLNRVVSCKLKRPYMIQFFLDSKQRGILQTNESIFFTDQKAYSFTVGRVV